MKTLKVKWLFVGLMMTGSISMIGCKGKTTETTVDTPTVAPAPEMSPAPAPVVISADDSLRTGVTDATKDFPTVTASVNDGEIILTGEITRAKLPNLMQSIASLHPKKITNNLKIK